LGLRTLAFRAEYFPLFSVQFPQSQQLTKTASICRIERRKTKIEIREVAIIVVIAEQGDGEGGICGFVAASSKDSQTAYMHIRPVTFWYQTPASCLDPLLL
jgi:hypothetical protein